MALIKSVVLKTQSLKEEIVRAEGKYSIGYILKHFADASGDGELIFRDEKGMRLMLRREKDELFFIV